MEERRYEPAAIKRRLITIRYLVARDNKSEFARRLSIIPTRWYNIERGYPLTVTMAFKIANVVPGLTLSWIYEGIDAGIPPKLKARLDKAQSELFPPPSRSCLPKSTGINSSAR
jgi:hypothetical protein